MNKKIFKAAFTDSLPVLAGYISLGIGFGVLLANAGFGALWSALMGSIIYAGSMQYVAVDLLKLATSLAQVTLMTVIIQFRHFFYGISMLEKYSGMGKTKPYLIFALTDETFSLVCRELPYSNHEFRKYAFYLSMLDHCYWVTGCIAGGLIGSILPFDSTGIDFAMTALFIVIFCSQWQGTKKHLPAITGVVSSVICLFIFGADNFIIPSMVMIVILLLLLRPVIEKGGDANER